MAIPKKGSRKITVDGVKYRWRIRWKPNQGEANGEWNLNVAVELYENSQSVLAIKFPWIPKKDFWDWYEVPAIITPKIIESCIKTALSQGWKPNEKSKTFTLIYEKA